MASILTFDVLFAVSLAVLVVFVIAHVGFSYLIARSDTKKQNTEIENRIDPT